LSSWMMDCRAKRCDHQLISCCFAGLGWVFMEVQNSQCTYQRIDPHASWTASLCLPSAFQSIDPDMTWVLSHSKAFEGIEQVASDLLRLAAQAYLSVRALVFLMPPFGSHVSFGLMIWCSPCVG
jgi:hypothetical protein